MTYRAMGQDLDVTAPSKTALPLCAPAAVIAAARVECQRRRDAGLAAWSKPPLDLSYAPRKVQASAQPQALLPATHDWSKDNPCDIVKLQPCEGSAAAPTYMTPPTRPPDTVTMPTVQPTTTPPGTEPPDTTADGAKKEPNYLLYGVIGVAALGVVGAIVYGVTR